jgi:hypothetical protein
MFKYNSDRWPITLKDNTPAKNVMQLPFSWVSCVFMFITASDIALATESSDNYINDGSINAVLDKSSLLTVHIALKGWKTCIIIGRRYYPMEV